MCRNGLQGHTGARVPLVLLFTEDLFDSISFVYKLYSHVTSFMVTFVYNLFLISYRST